MCHIGSSGPITDDDAVNERKQVDGRDAIFLPVLSGKVIQSFPYPI